MNPQSKERKRVESGRSAEDLSASEVNRTLVFHGLPQDTAYGMSLVANMEEEHHGTPQASKGIVFVFFFLCVCVWLCLCLCVSVRHIRAKTEA